MRMAATDEGLYQTDADDDEQRADEKICGKNEGAASLADAGFVLAD